MYFDFAPIDDYALIVYNLAIREPSLESVRWFFTHFDPELYIPLTYLSFFGEYLVWGLRPEIFHLDNLILHGLNALLVVLLVGKLSSSRLIAAGLAGVFAVHPLQAEAVVWIAARKDLLMTFWALITVLLVLRSEEQKRRCWLWVGLGTFVLALLSKVSVAALPLVLVILLRMQHVSWKCIARRTAPFFVLALVTGVVAIVGKGGVAFMEPLHRAVAGLAGMTMILGRVFAPAHLSVFYPVPALSAMTVMLAAIPLALGVVAWFLRHRAPLVSLGLAWTLLLLLPPMLNVQVDDRAAAATFAADRYAYLPLVGVLLALGALVKRLPLRVVFATTATIGGILIVMSRAQTIVWASPAMLYQHALDAQPASVNARLAVVRMLRDQDRIEDAFAVLLTGLRYGDQSLLHVEAGAIYASTGRIAEAEEQFQIARQQSPDSPESLFALGELLRQTGEVASAKALYQQAVALEPRFARARVRLAVILENEGDLDGAERLLQEALDREPENPDALFAMIDLLKRRGAIERVADLESDARLLYPEAHFAR